MFGMIKIDLESKALFAIEKITDPVIVLGNGERLGE